MEFKITAIPYGAKPKMKRPHPDFIKSITEDGLRQLVKQHYELLKETPLRELFPKDEKGFEAAVNRSADYLIQTCGGSMLYFKNNPHPNMFPKHKEYKITPSDRVTWLKSYQQLLTQVTNVPSDQLLSFWNYIDLFSAWLVNAPE